MAREWHEPYPWKEEPSYGLLVSAIEGANCALVARDLEGRIVFMNRRALEWVGFEPHEVEGQTAAMFVPDEHRHAIAEEHTKVLAGDVRARLGVFRRKDGRTFPAVSVPQLLRNEAGELIGTISVVVELASVQTAKRWAVPPHGDFASTLQRIANELEAISLVAGVQRASAVPLDHPDLRTLSEREREILGGDGRRRSRPIDREEALHQPAYGAEPSEGDLPQARRREPGRAGGTHPRARPAAPERRPRVSCWRRRPDSNRGSGFCRPMPYHLATAPGSPCRG